MQYLVIFTPAHPAGSPDEPADFFQRELEEQAQTRVLYKEGGLREVWAREPKGSGAIVLFEANSPEHLKEMIDTFPLIQLDYARYEVLNLAPHPAFSPHP